MRIHEIINEARIVYWDNLPQGKLVVLENPTATQMALFIKNSKHNMVRAFVNNQTIYVWDGFYSNHDTIENHLHIKNFKRLQANTDTVVYIDKFDFVNEIDLEDDENNKELVHFGKVLLSNNPIIKKVFRGYTLLVHSPYTDDFVPIDI